MSTLGIVGLEPSRKDWLRKIGVERDFEVVTILEHDRVRKAGHYDMEGLIREGRAVMDRHPVDGITTFWDFPSSCITPILAEEYGLPTPGLRAVVNFEHKFWSRLSHRRVAPDDTPPFAAVDVFDDAALGEMPLDPPFWIKPFKGYSGNLAFPVHSHLDYREAIQGLRRDIRRLGDPFGEVLDRVDGLPAAIASLPVPGAIAEGWIDGDHCTLEGYVHDGKVTVYGVFDITREEDRFTFENYSYPSRLGAASREQMSDVAVGLMRDAAYDNAGFNIEFFVDEDSGRTWILEVNPRISQEHSHLMDWVDDSTNLQVMAEAALGRQPTLHPREGRCSRATKFFVRRRQDALVRRTPDPDRVEEIEERYAPCAVEILVKPGDRLSEMPEQEPHSFIIAAVHLGGPDQEDLRRRFEEVVRELDLKLESISVD